MHQLILAAHQLTDSDLLNATASHAKRERAATAELVAHLAEVDARGLALRKGFSSCFDYCRRALGFSESEAAARIEAARAGRRFPLVIEMLQAGELSMTTAMILGRHLTGENHERLLREARGRTKDQLKEMVAALAPKPDAPVVLRRIEPAASTVPGPAAPPAPRPPAPPAVVTPLAPERFRYQVTIGQKARDLLAAARELSRRDDEALIERALELLVEELQKTKFAATTAPRAPRERHPDSRHVPAHVRREVWARDGGRCAYAGGAGRCESRRHLEFHHVKPYEAGGEATVQNIQLRCPTHNAWEARVFFARPVEIRRSGPATAPRP